MALDTIPTMTNPYASLVGDRDAVAVIRETPNKLRKLLEQLGQEGLEHSYASDKWTAKQIVCHLADCEIPFGFRLRQTLAVENPLIQPFDQDKWAAPYDTYSGQHALEAFTVFRGWNLAFIKTLRPEDLSRPATHPERGNLTMQSILQTIAGHDTNHLKQLEIIAAQS